MQESRPLQSVFDEIVRKLAEKTIEAEKLKRERDEAIRRFDEIERSIKTRKPNESMKIEVTSRITSEVEVVCSPLLPFEPRSETPGADRSESPFSLDGSSPHFQTGRRKKEIF